MECNKDEAIRARELAVMKMKSNDFEAARKIVLKAQNLCPDLGNINQLLSICDVHCSTQKPMVGSEKDRYGVLQVAKFADEMTIRKQYRRLALLLHPDKNQFPGAEAAFKLICEAYAVLSDPQKKSLYDSKIRIFVKSSPEVPPSHHLNKTSQFRKQYGAESKVSNGFRSMNQHQTTQSSSSVRLEVFCTSCPFCCVKYQLDRKFVNTTLCCQKCSKNFTGYEMGAQGVPMEFKCAPEGSQKESVKPNVSQSSGFQENGMPNQGENKMGSQWCANKQTVRPQPGVHTESILKDKGVGRAAKVSRGSKATDHGVATNLNSGPTHVSRISSRKRQNISYNERDFDDDDDLPRFRKRSQGNRLSEDNGNRQNDALDGESAEHENQNGLHTDAEFSKSDSKETGPVYPEGKRQDKSDCDKGVKAKGECGSTSNNGADAVEIEIDSDEDAYSGDNSDKDGFQYDDPEFNDFDKDRGVNCFAVNQYWACYDSVDGMPRFYAKIKKVCISPFELWITWLEAVPADDTHKKWIDEELPTGCGNFKVGKTQKMLSHLTFSQQVHCEKGKRGSLIIHPKRGEVWALLKGWDLSWCTQPERHKEYKYEVVEVLSDFDAVAGARVCYLDKVGGFVSLFQRSSQRTVVSFIIRPNELYRFSHCIRSFKMTGSEREGVPVGSFELDPAALPLNPDHLYYPGKSKMETGADFFKTSKETGPVYPEENPQDKSDCDKGVKAKGEGDSTSKNGADAVEIEIDSDEDAYSGDNSDKDGFQYDDPEFNDFDKDRGVSCFAVNQYWACYDSVDGMPRFYAKVKKVCISPFQLWIRWLEAVPADDTRKKWIDEELPIGCGNFKVGKSQKMLRHLTFCQQVHCEKGKRGSLIIHPKRGEVWALFKGWDLSWYSQPEGDRVFKYEVVEVLSDFDAVAGVRVCYLDKVGGFVSLFQRSSQSAIASFMIRPNELYRFSHCIRSFKMTGSERGVPIGSFELDPAERDGVDCAPPKSGIGKGNFVEFDSKEFVHLDCSDE